ncbi:MAG: TonB-dependent receptor plug domain-containing protein [Burkholderiaceae bacterium]|nr:TonB-dependent receptor plug domain-containing protein [Burkholderiaceae bacterium]
MRAVAASIDRRAGAAAAAAVFLTWSAHAPGASAQVASLEPVVVTGSRTEQALDDALAPVTLITRADLERLQATELVELITRQAGLQFARAGGPGAQASVFARGANSSQLLVLVDGVRLNTVTSGGAVLGGIAVDAIDRIEIVRGNMSSLYGSEAIGGVVQIFTRGSGAADGELFGTDGGGTGPDVRRPPQRRRDASVPARLVGHPGGGTMQSYSAIDAAQVAVAPPFTLGANPESDGNRQSSGSLRATYQLGSGDAARLIAWTSNRTDFDSTSDGPATTHQEEVAQR